jgi:hypothetical protein
MITVKMRNENMIDPCGTKAEFSKLNLRTLSAINQKKPLIHI